MVSFSGPSGSASTPQTGSARLSPRGQLGFGLAVGSLITLSTSLLISDGQAFGVIVAMLGYVAAASFALVTFRRGFPHPTLGFGNLITVGRMALIVSILAALGETAYPWLVVVVASVALALDGFDGYLARRDDRVSDFGETLDMEVDSAFTVILAASAFVAQTISPVVLLLALPRYVFLAASKIWPWLGQPLPENMTRKVILVIQVIALISLQVPGLVGIFATPLVLIVGGLLLWSFGRDVVWLWQQRR